MQKGEVDRQRRTDATEPTAAAAAAAAFPVAEAGREGDDGIGVQDGGVGISTPGNVAGELHGRAVPAYSREMEGSEGAVRRQLP